MIDLLLHNLRTIGTHHCDGTVGEEAADEIERLRAEVAGLRAWLEADARCPCCDTTDACLEGCTFATDCPQDAERMAEVRVLLAARKGGGMTYRTTYRWIDAWDGAHAGWCACELREHFDGKTVVFRSEPKYLHEMPDDSRMHAIFLQAHAHLMARTK